MAEVGPGRAGNRMGGPESTAWTAMAAGGSAQRWHKKTRSTRLGSAFSIQSDALPLSYGPPVVEPTGFEPATIGLLVGETIAKSDPNTKEMCLKVKLPICNWRRMRNEPGAGYL
jgi:hypothetical protein